jgi:hypothetical protein
MKRSKHFLFVFAISVGLASVSGCNKCTDTSTVTIDAATQSFSITYLNDTGLNMINSVFNLGNVTVLYADRNINNPSYIPLPYIEDFSDGKLGPIPYTTTPEQALMGVPYNSEFIIKRDTYGWDTLRIQFVAQTDECKEYWSEISYFLNGDSVGTFQDQEIANFEIIVP